jgi:hypothetical protein
MEIFASGWLWASSGSVNSPARAYLTVDKLPQGTNVFATIAVSTFSQGGDLSSGKAGAVETLIQNWAVYKPDGSVESVNPTPNFNNNSQFINNCASVTFELIAADAIAWALANIFAR